MTVNVWKQILTQKKFFRLSVKESTTDHHLHVMYEMHDEINGSSKVLKKVILHKYGYFNRGYVEG